MAIIYSYPITTPQDSDLFIISRTPDDPDEISNFSVGVGTIAEYIIDKLIDPNAFDFQIPVFNQGGNRITGSIMSQDSSPSNGVAGTKITIAGNTTTTGNVKIDTLTSGYIPFVNSQAGNVLRDSGFYQANLPGVPLDRAIGLNTTKLDSVFGERPDLRIASREINDPGVLDLFRPDGDVLAGDRVGVLQYSLDDDNQYTVAQIEVKTIGDSGSYNGGGGKLYFKTSTNVTSANPTERLSISNTEADFSVPINVTDLNQSSFAGQVTIPLTPIQNTDAASKGYVDSQLDKDLQIKGDTGTGSINLDTQVFDVAGGTYIDTAAGGQTITVDISAVDGNSGTNERYLTKNNTWAEVATIPGTYTFDINADAGTAQTVNTTETLLLAGGTYINTSVGVGPEVTFNHNDTNLTLTNSTLSPGVGGSFSVIDSINTNLQGHVETINTLTVTLPQDTDNYVDDGTYSGGTLTLERTGTLGDINISGFLEIGTGAGQALAGDTTTITQAQADDITANNLKVSFPEAPSDGSQYARQNGGWSVVSGGGGGGTVTGTGTTNTLPIWSDGPNGVLGDSSITQILDAGGNVKEVNITTTSGQGADFKVNGAGSKVSLISGISGNDIFLLSGDNTGYYTYNFQMRGSLAVGRSQQSTAVTLDVGAPSDTRPAAWFRNGVVISNNPSGVQVDNTSMVIGAGSNDNVSGSDHCLIVGSNNQITSNSDQSVAFGQGNEITGSIDAFAVGNSNTLTSSLRTQALGFNNTITASSSFVAGGGNSITANSNIFALGDGHTVTTTGSTEDAYLLGTSNTITGGTGSFAIGSNLDGDTGNHMVIGYRNNKTSYPATNYSLGLGNTKFALGVGSTTTTNSNALLITEGGVNRGGGVAQVPRVLLPTVTGFSASNDAAADALGVPQGALYQNQGVVQINRGGGSTTDPLAGSGGGGISGSLADNQVAFGDGTDNIAGSDDIKWNGNTLTLGGGTGNGNFSAVSITGEIIKSDQYVRIGDYVQHDGDINTKFGFPADDTFVINTNGNEAVRVNSFGNVGIGTGSVIKAKLDVKTTDTSSTVLRVEMPGSSSLQTGLLIESTSATANIQKFVQGISTRGSITFAGIGGVAYNTSSDYRIKENVIAITDGIERVKQLKPSRFNFIGGEQVVDGFIAHEVQGVIPEAIHGEKDETEEYEISPEVLDEEGNVLEEALIGTKDKLQGIDQSKIVPLLTAALQEAIEKIETLEARVQALES